MRMSPSDRLPAFLLVAVVALLGVLAVAALAPGRPALPHPTIPGLLVAADPPLPLGAAATVFGTLVLVVLSTAAGLGFARAGSFGRSGAATTVALSGYFAAWAVLVALELAGARFVVAGFPASTAAVVYGIWPLPVGMAAVWVREFHRWVFRPEDRRRLESMGPGS